jgi:hypothetical protein
MCGVDLGSGGSTVVEHSHCHPKVKGSSPVVAGRLNGEVWFQLRSFLYFCFERS